MGDGTIFVIRRCDDDRGMSPARHNLSSTGADDVYIITWLNCCTLYCPRAYVTGIQFSRETGECITAVFSSRVAFKNLESLMLSHGEFRGKLCVGLSRY